MGTLREPRVIHDFGDGWTLRRWDYDGAPLELHGPRVMLELHEGLVDIEVDYDGSDGWGRSRSETVTRCVPLDKLRRLLAEAQADAGEGTP